MYKSRTAYSSRRQSFNGRRKYSGNTRKKIGHGQYIDPKRFVREATHVAEEQYVPTHTFQDFNLHELIQTNLKKKGYTVPTHIQDKAIPLGLTGQDVVGIANTGTGKTAAFMLPIINKLMANRKERVLILAPTRELAQQIQVESRSFSIGARLYDAVLIGGAPIGRQLRDLQRKPEIIIGTPGRIKDHLERGSLDLRNVKTVVLDEVDRMLDMGFVADIRSILSNLPEERQSMFFSATITPTISTLIETFTKQPVTIMARTAETSDRVNQTVLHYKEKSEKIDKLHDLLLHESVKRTIIFCETKYGSDNLSKELNTRGFTTDAMHGNKSQGQRQRALGKFKNGEIEILVATDVAARGIDVDEVTHVINFDIPHTYDDYTHRIGRTGRGEHIGSAVTFVEKS